jgi:hypothetical protein
MRLAESTQRTARALTPRTVAAPVVVGLLSGIVLLTPLGADRVVGVVIGIPFLLVLPGFVLSRAILPRTSSRPGCSPLERVCWTLGLGMALLIAGALLLNVLPSGLTSTSWVVLTLLVLLVAGVIAARRERSLGSRPVRLPAPMRPSPRNLLIVGAAVLIAGGAIALGVVSEATKASPGFSQLWLVPDDVASARAPGATTETAQLGVYSDEEATSQFRVELRPDGAQEQNWDFSLGPGQQWEQSVTVPGGTRTEAVLYRGSDPTPYRRVWVQP